MLVELRGTGLEPPYSHAHVSETAIHREILRIYRMSRPETRSVYDLGRDLDRAEEENWVIRWLLWHVFRYRDNRNRNRRTPTSNGGQEMDQSASDDGSTGELGGEHGDVSRCGPTRLTMLAASSSVTGSGKYWDPVRNG